MAIEIRPCDGSNIEDLGKVWSITYRSGQPYVVDETRNHLSENYIAYQDGEAVGAYGVSPMTATRGAAEFKCGGVLAVAVMPHIRNSGVGSEMMRHLLRDYYEKGYELAHLYAFRESWYRRFGYEVVGCKYKISVEAAKFPRVKGDLPIAMYGIEGLEKIEPCYREFAHRRSGLNLRYNGQWERQFPRESHRTIYAAGDPVEAYIIVQHKADFWVEQEIIEFAWTSRRGYESMLSVIRAIAKNKSSVTWIEPSDSPFRSYYWDNGATLAITNPVMYRVINVKKALEGLKPTASGQFSIQVLDDVIPENSQCWKVEFSPAGVLVTPTESAGLVMGDSQFAQAFLGEPSLAVLANNGFIDVNHPVDLEEANKLLPPSPTLCIEGF